jgi:hypothetical protein
MLLRKANWPEAWLSAKRMHKDRRARKHLLRMSLMLLIPFICIVYLAWLVGSGAIIIIPFLIPVIWWRSQRERQDSVPLHVVPQPASIVHELSPEERKRVHRHFVEMALMHAVMVDRAGSENFLKEKVLPDGVEVTARRVHLELLKTVGVWNRMPQPDRELMMMPDGHWEWKQINQMNLGLEVLRLLRWILRVDFYLPVVGQQLKMNYVLAHELVQTPQKILSGKELATVSMLELGRDAAQHFLERCSIEAVSRKYCDIEDEETFKAAKDISEDLSGKEHEDLVLGSKLVSEATKEDILWAISLSRCRRDFLTWAISMLEDPPADLSFTCISCN